MFSTVISKVFGFAATVLLSLCVILFIQKQSLQKKVIEKDSTISKLTTQRDGLVNEKKIRDELQASADEITRKKDIDQKELANVRDSALSELDKLNKIEPKGIENVAKNPKDGNPNVKDTKNQGVALDSHLDPKLTGMLDTLCARVRGSTCPNP